MGQRIAACPRSSLFHLPMPPDPFSSPSDEDLDPSQTLFFKRRKARVNLLPIIVVSVLVLGSGALLTWAVSQSGRKTGAPAAKPGSALAGRKVLTPEEARALENPPVRRALPVSAEPPRAMAVNPPTAFDASKPVRAALPPDPSAPPPAGDAIDPINLDINNADNAAVKKQVLGRIDLMPGVSPANKDKLYASVDHARAMGRVLTIPFEKGAATVRGADVDRLRAQVQNPEIKKLTDDPTVVFVVLGYADPKGSEKVNNDVSLARAKSVMETLRERCGFQNIMHSVAMGGSTLFGSQEIEKNRVVEIWAVLP